MIKLDDNLLTELGLGSLPKEEKADFLKHMYETLEMRVGTRLAERMSEAQMSEFEQFISSNDEKGAFHWLESNFPDYKDVVSEEFEKLKSEIKPIAAQIVAASSGADGGADNTDGPQPIPLADQPAQQEGAEQRTEQPQPNPFMGPGPMPMPAPGVPSEPRAETREESPERKEEPSYDRPPLPPTPGPSPFQPGPPGPSPFGTPQQQPPQPYRPPQPQQQQPPQPPYPPLQPFGQQPPMQPGYGPQPNPYQQQPRPFGGQQYPQYGQPPQMPPQTPPYH